MRDIIIKKAHENIGGLVMFLSSERNREFLDYLNMNILSEVKDRPLSERVYYLVNNIEEILLCMCGKHLKFIGFKNGYRKTCGDKECLVSARKSTNMIKYGVENPMQSREIVNRQQRNIREKYNGYHYMCDEKVREKFKNTMLSRYGKEWAQQVDVIKKKSQKTWNDNPNKESIIKKRTERNLNKSNIELSEIKAKRNKSILTKWGSIEKYNLNIKLKTKHTSMIKYGVSHFLKDKNIIQKRVDSYKNRIRENIQEVLPEYLKYNHRNLDTLNFLCKKCDSNFDINRHLFIKRIEREDNICLICNPILSGKSMRELEVLNFIKNNYKGVIKSNIKGVISNELDIYLPEINIAIEFNGLYWHSSHYKKKDYHSIKTSECRDMNIHLIHIWEDDWDYKKNIIKSIILHRLLKSNRIFARKYDIMEIDSNTMNEFIDLNYLYSNKDMEVSNKMGLYHKGEIVSIIGFKLISKGRYELLILCNKLNTAVIGGASKLLKAFISKYNPIEIISYLDDSIYSGEVFNKMGFEYIGKTDIKEYDIINGIRQSDGTGDGYDKIYGCSYSKYIRSESFSEIRTVFQ